MKVLFVCSRNQWRSPTAEKVWGRYPGMMVRSAGTSANARRVVSEQDLRWADHICVMEEKHKSRLLASHAALLLHTPIHVLDIPDEYHYMDPELVEEIRQAVSAALELQY